VDKASLAAWYSTRRISRCDDDTRDSSGSPTAVSLLRAHARFGPTSVLGFHTKPLGGYHVHRRSRSARGSGGARGGIGSRGRGVTPPASNTPSRRAGNTSDPRRGRGGNPGPERAGRRFACGPAPEATDHQLGEPEAAAGDRLGSELAGDCKRGAGDGSPSTSSPIAWSFSSSVLLERLLRTRTRGACLLRERFPFTAARVNSEGAGAREAAWMLASRGDATARQKAPPPLQTNVRTRSEAGVAIPSPR
jgi:hypothetical protein